MQKAVKEFPDSKLHFDRFDIALAESFYKAGDKKSAQDVLTKIADHYIQHLNYYNRFKGKKAKSVEGERLLSCYILAEIRDIAERYGMKEMVSKIDSVPEVLAINKANKMRGEMDAMISSMNQAATLAQSGEREQSTEMFMQIVNTIKSDYLNTGNSQIDEQAGNMLAFVFSVSQRYGLDVVMQQIQSDQQLMQLLSQGIQTMQQQ